MLDTMRVGVPGWRIVLLCPSGPLADEARKLGGAVLTGRFGPEHGLAASLRTLRSAVDRLRPDIVHSHLAYADIVAALAVHDPDVRLVSTEHGIARDDEVYHHSGLKARMMAGVHHLRQRRLDAAIAVSHATARVLRDKWAPPPQLAISIIPNGVDRKKIVERSPGLHFGSVSRLAPEKRIDCLVRAFALVAREHPEARLTLAGDGPLHEELVGLVADLGLSEAVDFPGYVDAQAQLRELDVIVQLSVWENASYTILDALVAGCGVVASDVGSNPEILPSSSLVDADDHRQVADVMLRQATEVSARAQLGDAWPTIEEMCARIAGSYSGARG